MDVRHRVCKRGRCQCCGVLLTDWRVEWRIEFLLNPSGWWPRYLVEVEGYPMSCMDGLNLRLLRPTEVRDLHSQMHVLAQQ